MKCDLHVHSTHSDGSFSIGEILDLAKHIGLDCLAITDHDTIMGIPEAIKYGAEIGLKIIPGIELSADSSVPVHILGYNIDYNSPSLLAALGELLDKRQIRKDKILAKLARYNIILDESNLPKVNVGRGHIARELRDQGFVSSIGEAFDRYLGENRLAYYPGERLSPLDAVSLIVKHGGVAVMAHPLNLYRSNKLEPMLSGLIPYGLAGIEAYYPTHTAANSEYFESIAKERGLFVTGGSDFHGIYKGIGNALGITTCELPKQLI